MINPKEDQLSGFAHWYLNSGISNKIHTPIKNGLLFIEGVSGIVLYRYQQFQVELFICQPNLVIPEHTHPNIDSFEVSLHGMTLRHCGKTYKEEDLQPYNTIRVKTNDPHGGEASKNGGSFMSIQHWLNGVEPTFVSSDWNGKSMGKNHSKQAKLDYQ